MPTRPHTKRQRGLALVVVLWIVTLLALQVSIFNLTVRDAASLASNELAAARGEALAAAGIEMAAARLMEGDAARRWLADGSSRETSFSGARLHITITDEASRFDINEVDEEVLGSLLRPFARSPGTVAQWVDTILVRRDADSERRPEGAKEIGYRPFLDSSEVGRVLGLPTSAVQTLARYLTVHGGDGKINPLVASREALLMLPGADEATIDRALHLRRRGAESALEVAEALGSLKKWLTERTGPAYRIEVIVRGDSKPAVGKAEAIILLGTDPAAPFRVLSWRYEPRAWEPEGGG